MTEINVLVVFASTRGDTERLALTVGVGAIQGRANIRLRRLPPGAGVQTATFTPQQREDFERMSRDYVAPRQADPLWADVVVLATSPEGAGSMEAYLEGLPALGPVAGKIAAPLASGPSSQMLQPIYAAAADAGLIVVPPQTSLDSADARHACGRRAVAIARALKAVQAEE